MVSKNFEWCQVTFLREIGLSQIRAGADLLNVADALSEANDSNNDEVLEWTIKEMFKERQRYLSEVAGTKMTEEEKYRWRQIVGTKYFDEHFKDEA